MIREYLTNGQVTFLQFRLKIEEDVTVILRTVISHMRINLWNAVAIIWGHLLFLSEVRFTKYLYRGTIKFE